MLLMGMATETIELTGHIVDSLLLAKVLDAIVEAGVAYELADVEIGRTNTDPSRARIELEGEQAELDRLIESLQLHGANRMTSGDLTLVAADRDGVLPAGFYSTTNLATDVLIDGEWVAVENPEMDCGLVVDGRRVRTIPMHRVRVGDQIVVGHGGVRVHAPSKQRGASVFEFMNSEVSSEKPKALVVQQVADRVRAAHADGRQGAGGVRARRGAHGRRTRRRPPHRGRLDRRALRRQRLRHPRHREQRARHLARRPPRRGHPHRGRPLEPPAGDQRGAPLRVDRRGRRRGLRHRRRHGRLRAQGRAVRARRLDPRRRAAPRRATPTSPRRPTPCAS